MNKIFKKEWLLHIFVIISFMLITLFYFYPLLEGKDISQHDVTTSLGSSKELVDYNKNSGEYSYWTNSMFGGMPAYQIFGPATFNVYYTLGLTIQRTFPYYTYAIVLMSLICFYILLITLGVKPILAAIGAFAYAFCSYNIIIIEAGHITKAYAIATIPIAVAGFLLIFKEKYLQGGLLTAIGLGLVISQNHFQITYYLGIMIGIYLLVELIYSFIEKSLLKFGKAIGVIVIATFLAILPNYYDLYYTYDYGKESTRSQSELTAVDSQKGDGLDKDYAFAWSYGKGESFTLLIPEFYGGSSHTTLSKSSNLYKELKSKGVPENQIAQSIKNAPTYWGDQPFTSGPVYVGAIICFLFVLGLIIVPGRFKWWLLTVAIAGLVLSWGKNFLIVNDIFFNYFPGYNKFRTVSMILVITCFAMVLLGILALKKVLHKEIDNEKLKKAMFVALGSTAGIAAIFLIFGGSFFSYTSNSDSQMLQQGFPQWYIDALMTDRARLLRLDSLRTIFFIAVAFAALWFFIKSKLKPIAVVSIIGFAIILDLWLVDTRYLNSSDFKSKREVKQVFTQSDIDAAIKQDQDLSYRVFNATTSTFNDAQTSYYHKSFGGYHGAKLRRFQEMVDYNFSKGVNVKILNMLNVKYFIAPAEDGTPQIQRNVAALGNAWFVDTLKIVSNADEEMAAIKNFEPATTAIMDKKFENAIKDWKTGKDTNSTIKLVVYKPDYLKYEVDAKKTEIAVFSEIYYPKYWQVKIDGKPIENFRVNYLLRALVIPQGKQIVEFKFEPLPWQKAFKISNYSSIFISILILLSLVYLVYNYYKKNKVKT